MTRAVAPQQVVSSKGQLELALRRRHSPARHHLHRRSKPRARITLAPHDFLSRPISARQRRGPPGPRPIVGSLPSATVSAAPPASFRFIRVAAKMAALVRGLMRRVVALPQAVRSVSGGGQRHEPYRPLPITSPLAGLPRNFRVREPPKPQKVDRWTEKRALFGVYDNVGILGEVSPYRLRALGGRGRRPEAAASEQLLQWVVGAFPGFCLQPLLFYSQAVSRSTRSTSSWGPSGCEAGGGMSCSGAFARSRWWEIGCSWTITTISKRGSGSCTSASTALGSTAKRHCGSAMGFCGVTVGIKPSFLQLCSQCFLQPLLCISGPAPRSCCCARPELFGSSAALVTSHVLLTVPACIFWLLSESLLSERFWPGFQLPFNLY